MTKILADSTCDLSPELIRRYNIGIIPLYVHLGEKEFKDGVNVHPEELYRWSDENGKTPKTAAPSIEDIEAFLDAHTNNTVKYVIKKEMRWRIRDMLDQLNISERIVYPGLDGLSRWLARHYYVK